ncbi:hypothetical protein [Caulobacter mirabilis]|uniref:Uncharacterized protein n=1 Tax=Caulobacter mirabilis TaxID=69666 RepID=A0A2D2AVX3_9CAUL|nr:hypothetical protein [Caulobacter mirabilis]ATQ42172.1 hypothetical protein CSW64_06960 [Caulobacter mirabilis]
MAKAVFQKNQKVWVESVGAWATIDKIVPIWAKGFDEPVRVTYDVGLGREFHAHELKPEDKVTDGSDGVSGSQWRLMRAKNKWQQEGDCAHHPFPGTYPVVVTDQADWGGWRTPGAEYDRDPHKIERQARLIASVPRLQQITRELITLVADAPEDAPPAIIELARQAAAVERYVQEVPSAAEVPSGKASDAA